MYIHIHKCVRMYVSLFVCQRHILCKPIERDCMKGSFITKPFKFKVGLKSM